MQLVSLAKLYIEFFFKLRFNVKNKVIFIIYLSFVVLDDMSKTKPEHS